MLEQDARPCDTAAIIKLVWWVLLLKLCYSSRAQSGLDVGPQLADDIIHFKEERVLIGARLVYDLLWSHTGEIGVCFVVVLACIQCLEVVNIENAGYDQMEKYPPRYH